MLALRSFRPLTSSLTRQSLPLSTFQTRTMASSTTAPLQEWLVIAPDHAGAQEKRAASRPKHIQGVMDDKQDMWLWGGAMFEEPIKEEGDTSPRKAKGSALLLNARTREEVEEKLKNDAYVKDGVWNWEEVQIIPFKSAMRKAL